jgi:hypothetical protein
MVLEILEHELAGVDEDLGAVVVKSMVAGKPLG